MSARSTTAVCAAAVAAVLVASAAVASLGGSGPDRAASGASAQDAGVLLAQGSDRRPSVTAADWITYADHVVVATAVGERESAPDASEVELGEGLVGRDVEMRVDRVLWSSKSAPVAAPATWVRSSMGWMFSGGVDQRTEIGIEESPRIEVGHSYVVALEWVADPCAPGSGQWLGLGEGSTVSFDGGALGVGEYEGRTQTRAQALADAAAPVADSGLEERLAGRGRAAIVDALATARPVPATAQFSEPAPTCEDGATD